MIRRARPAALACALVGLGIAGYLTAVHYAGATPVCAVGHGCATAQASAYAKLAGVPVALLGLLGYLAIGAALLHDGERSRLVGAGLALAGAGFSAWLTYVEVERLQAICTWCVGSAVCMAALAVLAPVHAFRAPVAPTRSASV